MERPWLKWESDLGGSRRDISVPLNFAAKSGTVIPDVEKATVGILLDDVVAATPPAPREGDAAAGEAGGEPATEKTVTIIAQDAAVDLVALDFGEAVSDEMREEIIAELARNRVLHRG